MKILATLEWPLGAKDLDLGPPINIFIRDGNGRFSWDWRGLLVRKVLHGVQLQEVHQVCRD
jgi:hypothetical protein